MSILTKSAMRSLAASALAAGLLAASAMPASAQSANFIAPIGVMDGLVYDGVPIDGDFDTTFGAGVGGTFFTDLLAHSPRTRAAGETDWFVFSATMGDSIQIHTDGQTDTVLGLFFDLSGLVEVGDDPKCVNGLLFDCLDKTPGQDPGFDLEFVAYNDDSGPGPFNAQTNLVVGDTGMYAIAIQEFSKNDPGAYSLTLAFDPPTNGPGPGPQPISEPGALAIFGLGLVCIGLARRRRAA